MSARLACVSPREAAPRARNDVWEHPTRFPLEFSFVRSANTAARFFLVICAIVAASCHHDLTAIGSVASVTVSPNTFSLLVGDTATVKPSALDANGLIVTNVAVTWTSADTTIATVSGVGLVTAKKLGKVNIVATAGGASGIAMVTVVAALPPSISSITGPRTVSR